MILALDPSGEHLSHLHVAAGSFRPNIALCFGLSGMFVLSLAPCYAQDAAACRMHLTLIFWAYTAAQRRSEWDAT